MANLIENVFLLLLAFFGGCFLTWTMTMQTVQKYESYLIGRGAAGAWNRESVRSRFLDGLKADISHPQENNAGTHRLPTPSSHRQTAELVSPYDANRTSHHKDGHANKTRVLCWVMTSPDTLHSRAISIKETWGPRCDVTLYMSSKVDPDFPAIGLPVSEGRNSLWNKTKAAFQYIYEHHFNDADWFMKVDDDTYVIVENLRDFLRNKNSSKPVYYGHQYKAHLRQGYMSGGSGYVMSKDALQKLVVNELRVNSNCGVHGQINNVEDVMVGLCLQLAGVLAGDSRDDQNRSRFLPLYTKDFFNNGLPKWYFKNSKYSIKPGRDCCSDSLISIHYVRTLDMMLLLDYYIHGIKLKT